MKTIADMQFWSGVNSRDHGFHADWPEAPEPKAEGESQGSYDSRTNNPAYKRQLQLAITEKLDLIHSEISEALEELRKGHDPLKTYYSKTEKSPAGTIPKGERVLYFDKQVFEKVHGVDQPTLKPEGFMVELADAVIRIGDLAFLLGADLQAAVNEKHNYNRTRPYKHGKQF